MSGRVGVNWYELLDVAPDASEDEIRNAWKAAIGGLDPTDRTFRVYNQAAEVLLDPTRRAGFDADLATESALDPEPPAASVGTSTVVVQPGTRDRRAVPGWLITGVALLTAIVVGVCAWLWFVQPADSAVEDSTRAAQSAAERAVVPILSYDAAHLDEDQQAAASYLTPDYRKKYDQVFEVIKQNAPATETVVTVQVVASGVVRSGQDRVDVLLFVNRPTTNKQSSEPVIYKDHVTLTMEKVDGEWLVDNLVTAVGE